MKKSLVGAFVSTTILFNLIFPMKSAKADFSFAGGAGTQASPWQIENCEQLQNINDETTYLDDYFILIQNIDCSMTNPDDPDFDSEGTWSDRSGFNPIGSYPASFTGNFDGAGFNITGLYINKVDTSSVGLFRSLGGYVSDLNLVDADVTVNGDYAGILAGDMCGSDLVQNITVTNVSSSGSVQGTWQVGGLIGGSTDGCAYPGQIISSHSSVSISGSSYVGGIVGNFLGTISDSYATGSVTGSTDYTGGLVGRTNGDISSSFATGNVTSSADYVGGLVGEGTSSDISNSFATGQVSGVNMVGGLAGGIDSNSSISKSYATGLVSSTEHYTGGLVGYSYGVIFDSYARGNVEGQNLLGGLVGQSEADIYKSYATGQINGGSNLGGLVGGILREGPALNIYSSFSTGTITASGGNIGGFAGLANTNIYNSGWLEIAGLPAVGYSMITSGSVSEIDYNESSANVFYDATHSLYTAGENDDVWNFTTIWLENENDYPTLRDMPGEETDDNDEQPTPTPTPSSSSSSNSSSGSKTSPTCHDQQPSAPDLFQINTTLTNAKLYFSPLSNTDTYVISFSTNPSAEEHGEQVTLTREGVQSHQIYFLRPNTTYYLKVRGQNGCSAGKWSNTMQIKTNAKIYYKNSAPQSIFSSANQTPSSSSNLKISTTPSIEPTLTPTPTPSIEQVSSNTNDQTSKKKCFLWWCW